MVLYQKNEIITLLERQEKIGALDENLKYVVLHKIRLTINMVVLMEKKVNQYNLQMLEKLYLNEAQQKIRNISF